MTTSLDRETNRKKKKEEKIECIKTCTMMYSWVLSEKLSPKLKNGVDFLLMCEKERKIKLENHKWHHFKFGVFIMGENNKLTVDCNRERNKNDLGHLKIKTSHLRIGKSCSISCDCLGYPCDTGLGKGEKASKELRGGGGASYGTKGASFNAVDGHGRNGRLYGEETLLKEIHFGSGGGSAMYKPCGDELEGGDGGGIIEIIVQGQIANEGHISCNGHRGIHLRHFGGLKQVGGGGGSGGSILIVVQAPHDVPQQFGTIWCLGGGNHSYTKQPNKGGHGRIAIYTKCDKRDSSKCIKQ
ncbi:hypothetical protein RFI_30530 [Reticulomyxa filosa]|uniref:Uncharacterized protein n=1 Tax=Reticulomyxa filosa TaxID=46433 RepID=X6LZU3_RETFI|nr:hypothetical protein RFI_30530 [Reticulomyxa filosa]|eukprot:ETO06856.1 hypothetical protein RFI_30530 [Reticulomyxa filosa]